MRTLAHLYIRIAHRSARLELFLYVKGNRPERRFNSVTIGSTQGTIRPLADVLFQTGEQAGRIFREGRAGFYIALHLFFSTE